MSAGRCAFSLPALPSGSQKEVAQSAARQYKGFAESCTHAQCQALHTTHIKSGTVAWRGGEARRNADPQGQRGPA